MPHNLTRRDFLRYTAAIATALWFSPALPGVATPAKASASSQVAAPAPTVEQLPPPALLGAPVDVTIGTDGVLWALGASGAPSSYDALAQAWQPFGGGIDAVAHLPFVAAGSTFEVVTSFFRGSEVFRLGTPAPVPIATLWPNLPPSFQQGIDGAAYVNSTTFYLFRLGQAAAVDVWGNVTVYPLTAFGGAGWPSGPWQDGLFDFVISGLDAGAPNYAFFVRAGEYIIADLDQGLIQAGPQPLSTHFGGATLALLAQTTLQAGVCLDSVLSTAAPLQLFGGPAVYALPSAQSQAPATTGYVAEVFAGWPTVWHPILQQAPAGTSTALWSITADGQPIVNDSTGWRTVPLPATAPALSLDSAADGSVFAVTATALLQLATNSTWVQAAAPTFSLRTVTVGDADHVWVGDDGGGVYRYQGGNFTQANLGVPATDIKSNPDGTLWHCSADNPFVYRFISEGTLPSEPIVLGEGIASVAKVSSTGFGVGCCLAQANGQAVLLRYTSPYVFKTGNAYWSVGVDTMAVGAASVFLFAGFPVDNFAVVALDTQTGIERWRYGYPEPTSSIWFAPIYDPDRHLVYVFIDTGFVAALDAQSGLVRWSMRLSTYIAAQPVYGGGMIFVPGLPISPPGPEVYVTAIDAAAALQQAAAGGSPAPAWSATLTPSGSSPRMAPLLYAQGSVYCAVWLTLFPAQTVLALFSLDAGNGSTLWANDLAAAVLPATPALVAPIAWQVLGQPALLVNAGQGVTTYAMSTGAYLGSYALPNQNAGATLTSALVRFAGAVYFCDSTGLLYALDGDLNPLPGSPYPLAQGALVSVFRVVPDASGQAIVIYGDPQADTLNFYSTATNVLAVLPTNQTNVRVLSPVTDEAMIYAGGWNTQSDSIGQIFAIRTSDITGLRGFVIESQLLQDYDPGAQAVARYQTQVTIVDDARTPRPFTGVKLWADAPLAVQIDGVACTLDPNLAYATTVDASGCLTLTSDAADLFATPLRLWASFMDPFERIVVYPDEECHARLPRMTADPTNDDPTRINLATGTNYAHTAVFSNQQQAQSLATAMAAACQAAGLGGPTATQALTAAASLPPYTAYADLPGMDYLPCNTPAMRPVRPQAPHGLSWSAATPEDYVVLPFAAAAGAVDALVGLATPAPSLAGGLIGSIFSDLWDKFKRGVARLTEVALSIGQVVYAGIQYIEDGVTKVFRFVVRKIEDVAATVGAFFVALGKAINDVIELLSLLLHFEQVVATHNILKSAISAQIAGLADSGPTTLLAAVQNFFATSEDSLKQAFCTVKQQIVPGFVCGRPGPSASPPVGGLTGVGATAHTIFSVTPKSGGSASSHAVAATWAFHKMRIHAGQATTATQAPARNPIPAFISGFAAGLNTDPTLQNAYAATLSDFGAAFTFRSPAAFLDLALFGLLDALQAMLLSSATISAALLEGLLVLAADLVAYLLDPAAGVLLQPLSIPILSDLYKALFGSTLTFLDVVILAAAIPVTLLYRIVEGQWLSNQAIHAGASLDVTMSGIALTPLARALGLVNGAFFFGRALLMPINDSTSQSGSPNPILTPLLGVISAGFCATALLKVSRASDLILAVTAVGLLVAPGFAVLAPAIAAFLALVRSGAFIADLALSPSVNGLVLLGGNLLGSLPALAQPLKLITAATDGLSLALLVQLDLIGNLGAALVAVLDTISEWDGAPTALPPTGEPPPWEPEHTYLPAISRG